jgi:hypothetical protein
MSKRIEFQMMDMKRIRIKERAKGQLLLCKAAYEEQLTHNSRIENIAWRITDALVQIMSVVCRMEDRNNEPRGFWKRVFNR